MNRSRLLRVAPTATISIGAVTATTPWWRGSRSLHAVTQALAPWAALAGLPASIGAFLLRRRGVALAGLALGVAGLGQHRWLRGNAPHEPLAPGPGDVRVGHFNVWFDNQRPAAAARTLAALDVDVLVLGEMTPTLTGVFTSAGLTDRYEHRIDRSRRLADGMVVWSRHPLTELPADPLCHERIRVRVAHPDGPIVVDGIHTQSPIHHARTWTDDLGALAVSAPDEPAVMVGDFNAAWTHPAFRRVVARGWRDAHRSLGLGARNSWRIDHPLIPPFVRLDHALVNDGLDAVAIDDIDLPGSDHRGFVVTLRRR